MSVVAKQTYIPPREAISPQILVTCETTPLARVNHLRRFQFCLWKWEAINLPTWLVPPSVDISTCRKKGWQTWWHGEDKGHFERTSDWGKQRMWTERGLKFPQKDNDKTTRAPLFFLTTPRVPFFTTTHWNAKLALLLPKKSNKSSKCQGTRPLLKWQAGAPPPPSPPTPQKRKVQSSRCRSPCPLGQFQPAQGGVPTGGRESTDRPPLFPPALSWGNKDGLLRL